MKKKLIALALTLALLLALFPTSVFAAEVVASGTCGKNLTWVLDSGGVLTISGTGDMEDYVWRNDVPWHVYGGGNGGNSIQSVVIEPGVTSIGEYAFAWCEGLTSITIPDSVTSIGESAFRECTGLTSITIPDSVTSIGEYAFFGCRGLTSITIPDSVTSIDEYAFCGCRGLTIITIGNSVTSIGEWAFYVCTSLTSIIIPDSVTSIDEAAFYGCTGLTSIIIPDSVTSIGYSAFRECTGLTSITIPDSVTSIGRSAFYNCTGLTRITIGNSVTSIGYSAFSSCTSLTAFNVDENNPAYSDDEFGVLFDKNKETLIQCPSGFVGDYEIPESVTSIGDSAFSGCTGLTSIIIPDSVTSIDYYAFRECTGLTSITIPDSVTSIGESAFRECTGLTSITIPDSVTSIYGGAFYGCTGLTSIIIPDSVTSIGYSAFSSCTSLTAFNVDENNPAYSDDEFGVLFDKNKETLIQCPGGFVGDYEIPDSVTSIGRSAFGGCTSLTSIIIPDSVTSIDEAAFYGCTGLTSIIIPDSVTSIGRSAFRECTGLTSITIPDSVTSIGRSAFYNCTGLTSITIPDSVTYIDLAAFFECTGLKTVYYAGSEEDREHIYIDEGNDDLLNAQWVYNVKIPEPVSNPFSDVGADKFYAEPVSWAVDNKITSGKTATTFAPEEACTRAQVVTFLWRANGSPKPSSSKNPFADVKSGQFYTDAVLWAVEKGITSGVDKTHFKPNNKVTRAQFVAFLYRAKGKPAASGSNPFKDVKAGQFYTDAVKWAVENGVTSGLDETTFGVNDPCTRGQVVTFLYRAYQ